MQHQHDWEAPGTAYGHGATVHDDNQENAPDSLHGTDAGGIPAPHDEHDISFFGLLMDEGADGVASELACPLQQSRQGCIPAEHTMPYTCWICPIRHMCQCARTTCSTLWPE